MKIDIAYSKEKCQTMTAIEANELWQNEELYDKHEFICPGKDCNVPITCAGMDKSKADQKRVPHYIWGHRNTEHSENCDLESLIFEWHQLNKTVRKSEDKKAYNKIVFDFNNINDSNKIKKTITNVNSKDTKKNNVNLNNHLRIVRPHYRLLSSLLNLYFDAKNNNDLDNQYVTLNFAEKSYTYKLSTLFKKISDYDLETKSKTKVFYGKATLTKYKDDYYINFEDTFRNIDAEVKCVIKKEDILKVKNAKAKLENFEKQLNKVNQFFVMGKLKKVEIKRYGIS
ncbi:hypothetical protein CBF77_05385, partial [Lactobacillus taiwanensis]